MLLKLSLKNLVLVTGVRKKLLKECIQHSYPKKPSINVHVNKIQIKTENSNGCQNDGNDEPFQKEEGEDEEEEEGKEEEEGDKEKEDRNEDGGEEYKEKEEEDGEKKNEDKEEEDGE